MYFICIVMLHLHLNDMEIPEAKHFILKGFEMGTITETQMCCET